MPELPSGTVTFFFSDIEGSTKLLHDLGTDYAGVLAEHRDIIRAAFAEHAGVEVDTQGDAFFAAFARASDAVGAAAEIQRRLAPGPIRVRIGVHTGEPQLTDEGYVGLDVHRGARVCAAGHGGQCCSRRPRMISSTWRSTLAICEDRLGNPQRAVEILEQTAERVRAEGDERSLAAIFNNLGNFALDGGDLVTARRYMEESEALNRKLGRKQALGHNLLDIGFVALAEDRLDEASVVFDEALTISIRERFADVLMWAIEGAAALAVERSSPADAARWLAMTTQPRADLGMADDFYLTGDARRAQTLESARAQLGEDRFEAAWAEGLALSLDEAAGEAADSLRGATEG